MTTRRALLFMILVVLGCGEKRTGTIADVGGGTIADAGGGTIADVGAGGGPPSPNPTFVDGATIAPIEFEVPSWGETETFVVSAVVPVLPGDFVPARQRWELDGSVVQTEVVSRDALDRPRSVEIIGLVAPRGEGTAGTYVTLPLRATRAQPVEWYAVAPLAWRAAHVDFFDDLAAWIAFATMPSGVIEWQSTQKIYDNYVGVDGCDPAPVFASTQAIGTNFHALTWWSLSEAVLAGRDETTRRTLLTHLDTWARGFFFSDNFSVGPTATVPKGENKAAVALAEITGVDAPRATPFAADRFVLPANLQGSVVFADGNPFAGAATAWPPSATTGTDCVQGGMPRSVGHHSHAGEPDQGADGLAIGARVQAALGTAALDGHNPYLRRAQEFGFVGATMQARIDDAIDLRSPNGGFNDHVIHMAPTIGEMQAALSH